MTLSQGFLCHFTLSSAPAHHLLTTSKSHEVLQTTHWTTRAFSRFICTTPIQTHRHSA